MVQEERRPSSLSLSSNVISSTSTSCVFGSARDAVNLISSPSQRGLNFPSLQSRSYIDALPSEESRVRRCVRWWTALPDGHALMSLARSSSTRHQQEPLPCRARVCPKCQEFRLCGERTRDARRSPAPAHRKVSEANRARPVLHDAPLTRKEQQVVDAPITGRQLEDLLS